MIDSILTFCDEVLSNPIWFYVITLLIKIVICFAITILFIPICVYIERRVAAWIQDRVGPNRAGIPLSIFRRFGMKSDLPFKKTLDYFGLPHDGQDRQPGAASSAWTGTFPSSASSSPWWTAASCS